jgi:hypothetical protein
MKLTPRQKEIFNHAFMAGLDVANTIKRSQVDQEVSNAIERYEKQMMIKNPKATNQGYIVELLAVKGYVTVNYLSTIFESCQAASNALYELKKKGIVKKAGLNKWVLNNIEVMR